MRIVVPILLIALFGVFSLAVMGMEAFWETWRKPDPQPIAFPHDLHAGKGFTKLSNGEVVAKLGMECIQCHVYVNVSKQATVPAVSICKDCHQKLPVRTEEQQKLKDYLDRNEAMIWQKIHSVPPHVFFSHKRHIKKGIDCAVCHGDMTVVKTVTQVRTLQMGFCVSCHVKNEAPRDCWTCHK